MELQKLAQEFSLIDFMLAQTDCPYENDKICFLLQEIEKLDKSEALRFLVAVIELKDIQLRCPEGLPGGLKNLAEFPFIHSKIQYFNTGK